MHSLITPYPHDIIAPGTSKFLLISQTLTLRTSLSRISSSSQGAGSGRWGPGDCIDADVVGWEDFVGRGAVVCEKQWGGEKGIRGGKEIYTSATSCEPGPVSPALQSFLDILLNSKIDTFPSLLAQAKTGPNSYGAHAILFTLAVCSICCLIVSHSPGPEFDPPLFGAKAPLD